ncbi:hypothetical protein NEMBOFW57_010682 [Staphylotrichum longicolle]|uniref:Uncharacterized protein n=1 Tax=Staphylotrichum longicolle TaxID=669026 RepID=A0AAD4HVH6_9PEZI|nr:hypothetical protein NEMBOFW57_010682 [Staphylotrichum longicolle]
MLHLDPLSPQDVTVHMSCPVQDDLEGILEDCSRLRRLGHFAEAIALFRDRLSHFFDNRYVLVQYAQCLYEAGQYAEVVKLEEEMAPPRRTPPDALQIQWDMLLLATGEASKSGVSREDNENRIVSEVKTLALKWRELRPANQSQEGIAKCMNLADECGSALGALDDAYLMTRPCLRWIMAKRMIKDNIELLFYDQAASPGHDASSGSGGFGFSRSTFPNGYLPVYVPIDGHIPHWKPRRAPHGEDFRSVAHMVFRAAEVLGDLDLQTACLQELLREKMAKIQAMIKEIENDLRQEASTLPIARAKLEIDRGRSGRERTPDAEGVPGEHTGLDDPVGLEPEGGLAADPKPNVLQRRATVEDYLGTSESGDKSDDTEDRGVRGPERARSITPEEVYTIGKPGRFLEFPGYNNDGKPREDRNSDGESSS